MSEHSYLTPQQLAQRWKGVISLRTIYEWSRTGRGPKATKFGFKVGFALAEVEAFEAARDIRKTMPQDRISAQAAYIVALMRKDLNLALVDAARIAAEMFEDVEWTTATT